MISGIRLGLFALITICCFHISLYAKTESKKATKSMAVLLIIASENYMDTELIETREELTKAGLEVKTASSKEEAVGVMRGKEKVDMLLQNVCENIDQFGAVAFIGGPGCQEYYENETAHKIAKTVVQKKKILAAICYAPNILAAAGVLQGKKATCCGDFEKANKIKKEEKNVVKDGRIITANGPEAAKEFGQVIALSLKPVKSKKKRK